MQVAGALEGSESLQLSEDRQYVKRKVPLEAREVVIQQTDNRLKLSLGLNLSHGGGEGGG